MKHRLRRLTIFVGNQSHGATHLMSKNRRLRHRTTGDIFGGGKVGDMSFWDNEHMPINYRIQGNYSRPRAWST